MTQLQTIQVNEAEEWREYDFAGRIYRIVAPREIAFREGGSTHRVTDAEGIVHIVPAPGHLGCVVRFRGRVVA